MPIQKESRSERLEQKAEKLEEKEVLRREKKEKKKMMRIKAIQSFSPIRDVDEYGIITTKDGRFVKILEFQPINFLLRSIEEQDAIAAGFAMAMKAMPRKVQIKSISKRTDISGFVETIKADMESETSPQCIEMMREQIELIQRVSWESGVSRRFFLIFEYEGIVHGHKPTRADIVSWFDQTTRTITQMLSKCENKLISPLHSDTYTLAVLYGILCRAESAQKTFNDRKVETTARYLSSDLNMDEERWIPVNDLICPSQMDTSRSPKYIIIDGLFYSFAYIPGDSYPDQTVAGWMSLLVNMGEGVDIDFFVLKEPVATIQRKLRHHHKVNDIAIRHAEISSGDYEGLRGAVRAATILRQGLAAGDQFCYMSTLITITASSLEELEDRQEAIKNFLLSRNLSMVCCRFKQEDAFLMSLPICKLDANLYAKSKRNILTSGLASAYPFVSFEVADRNGFFLGANKANGSMVFIDPYDTTQYANANIALMGMTGAGKTYTLQTIATRMREKHKQVFLIIPEKGDDYIPTCEAVGGQYVRIASGSDQRINIMEIRKADNTNNELLFGALSMGESILARKIQQLHGFFSLLVERMQLDEKQLLDEALIRTYARFGITDDNASLEDPAHPGKYKPMPILGDLHDELEATGEGAKRLYSALTRYVSGSAKSFNGQTNVDLDNPYIVLDVSSLTKEMRPVGMYIALDYVWDKVREDRTKQKCVILDELWTLIGAKASEQTAEFVLDIFKLIRSYAGSAIAATQDLNDFFAFQDGKYGKGIISASRIKFVLKLETDEARRVGEELKLSSAEIKEIIRFDRGEGLLVANANHVVVRVLASNTEHELFTTDPNDRRRMVNQRRKALAETPETRS